jgi:hypothetical protein
MNLFLDTNVLIDFILERQETYIIRTMPVGKTLRTGYSMMLPKTVMPTI